MVPMSFDDTMFAAAMLDRLCRPGVERRLTRDPRTRRRGSVDNGLRVYYCTAAE
jgi:hypothetical protein